MRENVGDLLVGKIVERKDKVSSLIARQYKSVQPFASRQLSKEEQLWAVENLGFEDLEELRQEYGDDAINYLFSNVYKGVK